ncbi:helix-turn-helix domain-containing protein, partial [Streptomyces sp. NPDC059082]|uniref:helix-turn-helix domain-containing protein n=1 Tax=Streptomyces sp. NPDC059082 TaxID=3346720 RepID=UPI0036CDA589
MTDRPGLRARQKAKTRAAIRRAAYRLTADHGWDTATTDRIAEAAEVSPSTVARYFPVREDILLTDEDDELLEARLRARPAAEEPRASPRGGGGRARARGAPRAAGGARARGGG